LEKISPCVGIQGSFLDGCKGNNSTGLGEGNAKVKGHERGCMEKSYQIQNLDILDFRVLRYQFGD